MTAPPPGPPAPEDQEAHSGPTPPNPYGEYAVADGLGGVAAPLLAGFAVTLMGLVLQIESALRWPGLALLLFGAAGVLLLQVVQYNARAKGYVATIGQALEWYGDADDPQRRRIVHWELDHHRASWRFWIARARRRYNLGIVLLLLGTVVLMVPAQAAQLSAARIAAIVVVAAGAALELAALLVGNRTVRWTAASPRRGPVRWAVAALRWAVPPEPPVPAPPLERRR